MSGDDRGPAGADGFGRMGKGMLTLFWLLVLGGGTLLFSGVLEDRERPNGAVAGRLDDGVAEVRLRANRAGHYIADGTINGSAATFLLDTGATAVAVPADLAAEIGLRRGPRISVNTANGVADAWLTRIDHLRLGTLDFFDVAATIAPGLDGEVLLGMSALRSIEMVQRDGELVLRQTR
ncbi:MAG TPA: TIGR02281 family clan AA aspartic protease [Pseudomonadales bacterium]|nr:TIGR02281 family clan AA aspartic protease [Pseudomonadales bacterium]